MKTKKLITLILAGLLAGGSGVALTADKVPVNPDKDVFFGTTHGHSNWSIDAFGLGNQ